MVNPPRKLLLTIAAFCLSLDPVFALPIYDFSLVPVNSGLASFAAFNSPLDRYTTGLANFSSVGPVSLSLTSTNPDGSYIGDRRYDLGVNGIWGAPLSFVAVDFDLLGNDAYSVTVTFSQPVSTFAALFNYRIPTQEEIDLGITYSAPLLEGLDNTGSALETMNLLADAPINTVNGQNAGAYRGFKQTTDAFYGFRISNAGIVFTDLYLYNGSIAALVAGGSIQGKPPSNPPSGAEIPEPSLAFPLLLALASLKGLKR